jgi:hypothetical protein
MTPALGAARLTILNLVAINCACNGKKMVLAAATGLPTANVAVCRTIGEAVIRYVLCGFRHPARDAPPIQGLK